MTSPEDLNILGGWGSRLAAARNAAGLTQLDLATALDVTAVTVQRWEAGSRRPSEEDQTRLARVLRISITELFPRTEDEAELVVLAGRIGMGCS